MKTVLEFTRERLIKELEKERIRKNIPNNFIGCEFATISRGELLHFFRTNNDFLEKLILNNKQELNYYYEFYFENKVENKSDYIFTIENKRNWDNILYIYVMKIAATLFLENSEIVGYYSPFIIKNFTELEKENMLVELLQLLKQDKTKVLNLEDEI